MEEDYLDIAKARQSFLDKYDINSNLIESSKFLFVSHNMPHLNFFVQAVTLPSVSIGEAIQDTPYSTIYRAGDKMNFEPIAVTFLIDEDLKVWEELYNWMKGISFPHTREEYRQQKKAGIYADVSLLLLKNSYESNLAFRFNNCWPTFLGPAEMSSAGDAEQALLSDVTFRFDTFQIVRGSQ